jgi:diguanylate cyclase (GGDEF)-like protein/PAS domain S-box-containing protein
MSVTPNATPARALVLAGAYVLYAAFAAAWLLGGWGGDRVTETFAGWAQIVPPLVGLVMIVMLLRTRPMSAGRRLAWLLLAVGTCMETLGSTAWALTAVTRGDTYPSGADYIFLLYYPFATAACLAFFRDVGGRFDQGRFWLDLATLVIGFGGALWFIVFEPLSALAGAEPAGANVTIAYALGNGAIMIAGAMLFTQVSDWRRDRAMLFFLGSLLCTLVSDLWWIAAEVRGQYEVGALIDLGYFLDYAVLAAAVVSDWNSGPSDRAEGERRGNAYGFLPLLAVLLALVMLLRSQVGDGGRAPIVEAGICVGALLVLFRQLTVRREVARLQEQLARRSADERLTELVRRSSDVFLVVGADGLVGYASPACETMLGRAPEALVGQLLMDAIGYDEEPRVSAFLLRLERGDANVEVELTLRDSRDDRRTVLVVGSNQRHVPSIRGDVLTLRDITDRKRLEERLRSLAFYDPLTLLANRSLFADRVHHAMARLQDGLTPAVIFIDLDNFKTINDSLGHSAGDRLLRACAQRVVQSTGAGDTVARLGGDEFAVLIDHAPNSLGVVAMARHIRCALQAPIEVDGRLLRVTASLGVAVAAEGTTAEHVLRNADAAMYRAKHEGKDRVALFQPEMLAAARRRLEIEEQLVAALANEEFVLHYQPIVDLRGGHLVGVEALLRWRHATRGMIQPGEFIPVAEETGFIVPLTNWILRRACKDLREMMASVPRGEGMRVAVNVSGRHLLAGDLVADVRAALEESGLPPTSLVIEMTESLLLQESREVSQRLAQLKSLGVRLALDDFGTGYSSLAYLHRFPLDILKIDRSFVQRLSGTGEDRESATALARAILSLAEALGLDTVAEGVEDPEQRLALLALGCHTGQGYWFGKPMAREALLECPPTRRRALLSRKLAGPVDYTATGRFQTLSVPLEGLEAAE